MEISKPVETQFWWAASEDGAIVYHGETLPNQVTTTGLPRAATFSSRLDRLVSMSEEKIIPVDVPVDVPVGIGVLINPTEHLKGKIFEKDGILYERTKDGILLEVKSSESQLRVDR